MLYLNNLIVMQDGQMYYVYLPQKILVCQALMPPDGQVLQDMIALKTITGGIGKRYNIIGPKKR